jgi:hypothetical protein
VNAQEKESYCEYIEELAAAVRVTIDNLENARKCISLGQYWNANGSIDNALASLRYIGVEEEKSA